MRVVRRRFLVGFLALFTVSAAYFPANAGSSLDNVLAGQVVTPDGVAIPRAFVRLSALSSHPSFGKPRPDPVIGTTTTDAAGRFAIPIPSKKHLLALAAENNGHLNVELFVSGTVTDVRAVKSVHRSSRSSGKLPTVKKPATKLNVPEMRLSSSARSPGNANTAVTNSAMTALGTTRSSVAKAYVLATALTIATNAPNQAHGIAFSAPNTLKLVSQPVIHSAATTADHPGHPCPTPQPRNWQVGQYDYPWVPIGDLHIYWDGQARLTYGATADSDLGVGYSYAGAGWKAGGEVHIGNSKSRSVSLTIPAGASGRRIRSVFTYVKEKAHPYDQSGCEPNERVRALNWYSSIGPFESVGGDGFDHVNKVYNNCPGGSPWACVAAYWANSTYATEEQRSITYSGGVSVFGLQLSARSGWSTMVRADWQFGGGQDWHWLFYDKPPYDRAPVYYSY